MGEVGPSSSHLSIQPMLIKNMAYSMGTDIGEELLLDIGCIPGSTSSKGKGCMPDIVESEKLGMARPWWADVAVLALCYHLEVVCNSATVYSKDLTDGCEGFVFAEVWVMKVTDTSKFYWGVDNYSGTMWRGGVKDVICVVWSSLVQNSIREDENKLGQGGYAHI